MGQGPEQATPDALGIEQAGPKKLGKGARAQNRVNKKPWDHTIATTEKLGQYAADRHGQRRFSLPSDPKIPRPQKVLFSALKL